MLFFAFSHADEDKSIEQLPSVMFFFTQCLSRTKDGGEKHRTNRCSTETDRRVAEDSIDKAQNHDDS